MEIALQFLKEIDLKLELKDKEITLS